MRTIHQLPETVISKIAAGEVVEHPASVIKELIENSIDAEAKNIDITLEKGGIRKIVIKDDGKGMSKDDLEVCYLPHTTSKIQNENDLFSIYSFGFRGEALSSVAAVSNLTIKSRQYENEFGHIVEVSNNQNSGIVSTDSEPVGMSPGTEIIVEGLFNSIPARKKFLNKPEQELRSIIDVITQMAMIFPGIGFCITNDQKRILQVGANQSLTERMHSLLGDNIVENLLPLNYESEHGIVSGFVGMPQSARAGNSHQYLFINNRPLNPSLLNRHVIASFGSLIEPRTQSMFILFLSIPPHTVDINIHPRKLEVGLSNKANIEALVGNAVKKTLEDHDLTYVVSAQDILKERRAGMDEQTAKMLKGVVSPWNLKQSQANTIIRLNNLYLIAETNQGLLLVDQHAAHERILYEQFKEALGGIAAQQSSYTLETPSVLHLSTKDSLLLESELDVFSKLGFEIEIFGHQSFKISKIPELFKTRELGQIIIGVLDDIQNGRIDFVEHVSDRTLAYLACRAAIKAGDPLEEAEARRLIEKLISLDHTSYTCPHGRPTHITLSMKDLDVLFKRK